MTAARHIVSPAIWGLALLLASPGLVLAQQPPLDKVVMPWQKPKAQPPENFSDVLPWLLNGGSSAGKTAAQPSQWQTSVEAPSEPIEPTVTDFKPEGKRLETGTIAPSGLVLKKPLPALQAKSEGNAKFKASTAAEAGEANGAGKIKNSVTLPGDHPVGQATAPEIPSSASDVAAPAAADEAAQVDPQLALPVQADEVASPRPAEQSAQAGSPADHGAVPADANFDAVTPAETPGNAAAPITEYGAPAHSAATKFSPVRPVKALGAHAKADAGKPGASAGEVAAPSSAAAVAAPEAAASPVQNSQLAPANPASPAEAAAPVADHAEAAHVVPASPVAAVTGRKPDHATAAAPHRIETAQVAPSAPVEAAPSMPQAEDAPSIPDPLPEAVVTPVAKPVTAELPVQHAKELPAAVNAMPGEAAGEALPGGKPTMPERLGEGANVAQQYCFNIADAAKDARYAWQKKTLADIEAELKKRIALLDERTAEYQKWLARRDEFIRNAEENVVKIYAGMAVDAAAVQLALMNEEAAAAVLAKLKTRNASAILNVMEPAKAAKLTMIITGAAKLKRKKELQQSMPAQGASAAPAARSTAAQPEGGRS